jgi:hypothetical protein
MPVLHNSSYKAPWYLLGAHIQSFSPRLFRRVPKSESVRRRIETPDDDFLDIDLVQKSPHTGKLLILSHGMEGHSGREYIRGMAGAFLREGWSTLAWNFRSCGPESNRQRRLYHCADLDDIRTVITYALSLGYTKILLSGFSMGGNITLRYLGILAESLPKEILGGIVFSAPCDLASCSFKLDKGFNRVYRWIFLRSLKNKMREKSKTFPEIYTTKGLRQIKTLSDFDNVYTAPVHGFLSAEDYYTKSSCIYALGKINRPTLIVNALNDPFLAPECFPYAEAGKSEFVYLETPREGGHVGFGGPGALYWSEKRALEFAREHFY